MKKTLLIVGVTVLAAVLVWALRGGGDSYSPVIEPALFSKNITNPYFTLPVGRVLQFEEQTADGLEKITIEIEPKTKTIMGVETVIYRDKVYLEGVIVEDTLDYLAQDAEGNVWYFGEEVDNYEKGVLVDHAGSWIAGVDGALPGIWIKAKHVVGDVYRQEYYRGEAEDMRTVLAINETVVTKAATYTGCVKVYDWTPLDAKSRENKFYCTQTGSLVVNENVETGERAELVKATNPK